MKVLIKGMEMPNNCCGCDFSDFTPTGKIPFCRRTRKDLAADVYFNKRDSDCPLVPVPPHGRLIDADEMRDEWLINGENEYVYDTNAFLESIDNQPTVIPAEFGGAESK